MWWFFSSSSSRTSDGQSSLADKCCSPLQIREAAVELLGLQSWLGTDSHGRQPIYESGNSENKTNAEDGCTGPMARNGSVTHFVVWMVSVFLSLQPLRPLAFLMSACMRASPLPPTPKKKKKKC